MGRLSVAERILYMAIAVLSVAIGVRVAVLLGSIAHTPRPVAGVSANVANGADFTSDAWPAGKFGTPRVTLDLDALASADCWYEVSMLDRDGKPGGIKLAQIEPVCP
jgi:hypothetical protein